MKISSLLSASFPRARVVALLCLLSLTRPDALAIPITIDTSTIAGQSAWLAFDLVGGDGAVANNTVSVSGFATDGTLGSAGSFALTDFDFWNEELREITFGTFLNFTLELTENVVEPGFDQFSFFLLASDSYLPLFSTNDPFGADALFAIDITGAPGGAATTFEALRSGISWQVGEPPGPSVPDTGGTLGLFGLSLVGLMTFHSCRRQRERFAG